MNEFHFFYVVWALLPLTLLAFTVWAFIKKSFKMQGREYASEYFKQTVFCAVLYFISIYIDRHVLETWIHGLYIDLFDPNLFRWLLYPALLVICAFIFKPKIKKEPKNMPGSKYAGYINKK